MTKRKLSKSIRLKLRKMHLKEQKNGKT